MATRSKQGLNGSVPVTGDNYLLPGDEKLKKTACAWSLIIVQQERVLLINTRLRDIFDDSAS